MDIARSRHQQAAYIQSQYQRYAVAIPADLDPENRLQRIVYYRDKPLEWMAFYLRKNFRSAFAEYHPKVIKALRIRGRLNLIVLQRGGGKGTIIKGFTAHIACYGLEPYFTRMEHDGPTAKNELLNLVQEFKTNPYILADYGNMLGDAHGYPMKLSEGSVFFVPSRDVDPVYPVVYMRFVGLDTIVRGTVTLDQERVGRVIVNDPTKNYVEAHSAAHTTKTTAVIKADVGFAGGSYQDHPIAVTVVGTCMAKNDVIDTLRKEQMTRTLILPGVSGPQSAIDGLMQAIRDDMLNLRAFIEGFEDRDEDHTTADHQRYITDHWEQYGPWLTQLTSNWEARFPLCDHVFLAATWGIDNWLQEVEHYMIDTARQRFWRSWFMPYSRADRPETNHAWTLADPILYRMTIDVAGTKKSGNDPKAILAGAYNPVHQTYFVLSAWCDYATASEFVRIIYETFWEAFPWYMGEGVLVIMEDTMAFSGIGVDYIEAERLRILAEYKVQELEGKITADEYAEYEEYWRKLPIVEIAPVAMGSKLDGIASLVTICEQRRIWYIPGHSHQELMLDQFENHRGIHTHNIPDLHRKNELPDCFRMWVYDITAPLPSVVMEDGQNTDNQISEETGVKKHTRDDWD